MQIVRFKFLKTYNALIAFLISLLGFGSSCDLAGGKAMYGTPTADFIVKGKVEAATANSPVAGIKVEMSQQIDSPNGKVDVVLDQSVSLEGIGNYQVSDDGAFPDNQTYRIRFTDVDGAQNGEFETLDTTIVFQNPKFSGGDGNWYHGKTEKVIQIKLKAKK